MNQEIVESVQHAITPAECQDLYYPGKTNTEAQCFPATMENRFYVALNATSFGSSSQITFNPDQGVSDIVLNLQLPVAGAVTYANWALGRGWGYSAIRQIGFRVGGSSLYYISGDQMMIDALDACEDQAKKDAILALGGGECLTPADFANQSKLSAYVYIKLPWNSPSSLQKPLPLPSDLLTQPIQMIIEFNPASNVFVPLAGASVTALPPNGFSYAQVNFRQVHLADSGHLLARRVNMNENALTYPLRGFLQTAFKTTLDGASGLTKQVNLTGFRQGSVKDITLWAVKASDLASGQGLVYAPLLDVQLAVNGLVYYQTKDSSSQMWGLIDRKTPTVASTTILSDAGGGVATATPVSSAWTVVPLAQVAEPLAGESDVVLGLPIQNSVVNLTVTLPTADVYVLVASYKYVASLMFSRGSAEYVF